MPDERINIILRARDQASRAINNVRGRIKAAGQAASAARGPLLLLGGVVAGSVAQWAKAGDEVHKMSIRTGVSTEKVSELRFALEQSGTDLGGFEKAMKRMALFVGDASEESEIQVQVLKDLGLEYKDLEGQSPEEVFDILSVAIAGVDDDLKRAALAQDVFGGAGTKLLPLFDAGVEGMAAMAAEARDLGVVLDQDAANKAANFSDALNATQTLLRGMAFTIAEVVGPVITVLLRIFQSLPGPIRAVVAVLLAIQVASLTGVVPGVLSMSRALSSFSRVAITKAIGALKTLLFSLRTLSTFMLTSPIGWILMLAAAVAAIVIFRKEIIEFLLPIIEKVRAFITGAFTTVVDFFKNNWPEIIALISGPFILIVALATDAFGVRSAITGAFTAVINWVKGNWQEIITLLSGPFILIVAIATDAFGLRSALEGAFRAVINWVTDNWQEIITLLSGPFILIVALATDAFGVRSALEGAFQSVINWMSAVWFLVINNVKAPFVFIIRTAQTGFGVPQSDHRRVYGGSQLANWTLVHSQQSRYSSVYGRCAMGAVWIWGNHGHHRCVRGRDQLGRSHLVQRHQ